MSLTLRRCPFCCGAYNIEIFGPLSLVDYQRIEDGRGIRCRGCRDAKTILCDPARPDRDTWGHWAELEGRVIIGRDTDIMFRIIEVRGDHQATCAYFLGPHVETTLTLAVIESGWLFLPIPILDKLKEEFHRCGRVYAGGQRR